MSGESETENGATVMDKVRKQERVNFALMLADHIYEIDQSDMSHLTFGEATKIRAILDELSAAGHKIATKRGLVSK